MDCESGTGNSSWEGKEDPRTCVTRDADRRYYLEGYYQKDANEPCLYDLQIDTATIPSATAGQMIVSLVRSEAALA
jgi:cytidylate kinase